MSETGRLTTHVLDTMHGSPAAGLLIELLSLSGQQVVRIAQITTNSDGRSAGPLLEGPDMTPGSYQLIFHVGDYYRRKGVSGSIPFLDLVPVRFGIDNSSQHYHVPLLVSPYGYSTYRGS
jgi:5-hydroxyisourate hydrolase